MNKRSKDQKTYLLLNFGLLAFALFLYCWGKSGTPFPWRCFFKEFFGIYCPLCGGSRATLSLMMGDFQAAVRYNPFALLLEGVFLLWDAVTLLRFCKGKKEFFRIPGWVFPVLTGLLILFFVARNFFLLEYGIDPIGDFAQKG